MENAAIFPTDITGRIFSTNGGTTFKVLAGEHFPSRGIGKQHSKYLSDLRAGLLVSVSFYGQPVPLITVGDGVVRLKEIECNGAILSNALAISQILKITKTREPVALSPV